MGEIQRDLAECMIFMLAFSFSFSFFFFFWWSRLAFKRRGKSYGIGVISERFMREEMCLAFLHGFALRLYAALFVWGFWDFGIFLLWLRLR